MNRKWLSLLGAVLALVIGFAIYQTMIPATLNGGVIEPPLPMPDFTLESVDGPVHLSDFRGKYVVLFFGFTNCPDVCPLTMAGLRQAVADLGDKAGQVQVLFVSVDYRRDTPETVAGYTTSFRPDFIGLTGSKEQIDQVTGDFGIYYKLGEPEQDGEHAHGEESYDVEHTTTIQVLDREGKLILTWAHDTPPDKLASDLKVLIAR
jgi:protein SCO1